MYIKEVLAHSCLTGEGAGVAILTNNSTKKNHETLSEEGVGKKGKGFVGKFSFGVVCQNIIPLSL